MWSLQGLLGHSINAVITRMLSGGRRAGRLGAGQATNLRAPELCRVGVPHAKNVELYLVADTFVVMVVPVVQAKAALTTRLGGTRCM